MRICQCTTVHKREDLRVFYKTSVTLAKAGHEVYLIVADGKGDEKKYGVSIIDLGNYNRKRKERITVARKLLFNKIKSLCPDVVQLHDPELLTLTSKLKNAGFKVVYDSHEDVTKQIQYKEWLGPSFMRNMFSKLYDLWEKGRVEKVDALISVIDEITNKFQCKKKVTIKNFPIIDTFYSKCKPWNERANNLVYVGTFSEKRGVLDYVNALKYVKSDCRLLLIGKFDSSIFEEKCKNSDGWSKVDLIGFQPMEEVAKYLGNSKIGLSVLHPEKNYLTSLPTKGFEYMAAGTPVLMSDFEYWRPYFSDSARFISPNDPVLLARNIDELLMDENELVQLHENCKKDFKKYSWEEESKKLLELYDYLS